MGLRRQPGRGTLLGKGAGQHPLVPAESGGWAVIEFLETGLRRQ